jgi:hypothetical protein
MHRIAELVAAVAAIAVASIGFAYGTYAAGGSDSSCYALMADAFASGNLQPTSALVSRVPWPDAQKTFTPGGFVPSETLLSASAPVCAPGFSLLLAPLIAMGGGDAAFVLTPLAGALLVWLTFVASRHIAGSLAGALAAVLVAVSPPMLYQVVQPMNDVTTAALWMATFVALTSQRWAIAGVCCGAALLVRPNLLPLGAIATLFVILRRGTVPFALGAIPFGLLVLGLNRELYGSPFRTGYGQLGHLFGLAAASVNAANYPRWLIETHTVFPLLAFAAPFAVPREKRADVFLALGLILSVCGIYFVYTPFDDWSYLRFLLPAIALMLVLASAVWVQAIHCVPSGVGRTGAIFVTIMVTSGIAFFCVRTAEDRLAFTLRSLEQRFRSAGLVVRDRLPENAVVFSVWDSGAVRFHGRKEALIWEGLDPAWLDRSLDWLDEQGHSPYILLESWEEPAFRSRFEGHSDIGKLDWPPKYDIDRVVRIYDPKDRRRFDRGEHINTEYLWPLRD